MSGSIHLGGGLPGISPPQSITNYKTSETVNIRSILRNSWNGLNARNELVGNAGVTYKRVATPFRAAMNQDDFLSRKNYVCGGPNPTNASKPGYARFIRNAVPNCDATGIPGASCNPKFVADSSDYTRFRKEQTYNRNYNDKSFGGDQHHGSYTAYMRVIGHR